MRNTILSSFSLSIFIISLRVEGVKFPYQNGITMDGNELTIGKYSSLSCNFVKWKQETINKVEWSLGYQGVSTPFFTSNFGTGGKDVPRSPFFSVDQASSGEKVVRLMITEERAKQFSICCRVQAIRDSGYGSMRKTENEKCTSFPVRAESIPEPDILLAVYDDFEKVGDRPRYECKVENHPGTSLLEMVIHVNGNPIRREHDTVIRSGVTITDEYFYQDELRLGCLLMNGNEVIAKKEVTITRKRAVSSTTRRPKQNQQARKARFYSDPQFHEDHGNVPCHSYILVEESATQGLGNPGTIIRGDLPLEIQGHIYDLRGGDGSRYESGLESVQVLNVLGYNGYRVVGMGRTQLNGYDRNTWTLEREYFEFH